MIPNSLSQLLTLFINLDPIDNYMNYIDARGGQEKGACYEQYGRFTLGQIERMTMMWEKFREETTSSPSQTPTTTPITGVPSQAPTSSLPVKGKGKVST